MIMHLVCKCLLNAQNVSLFILVIFSIIMVILHVILIFLNY
jgi:hypothetical protein